MYESPIQVIMENIRKQIAEKQDEAIWSAVQKCGVDVSKEELIKALQYDRGQYEKGYADGLHADKWLDVNYYFPFDNENVLAYMAWGGYSVAIYSQKKYFLPGSFQPLGEGAVTHWQPLPEPPKKQEET